jgi:ethanolamine utilization protein EutQ (cupin superfamily)
MTINIENPQDRRDGVITIISIFKSSDRTFVRYLGDDGASERGSARIAHLIGSSNSSSMGGGVVIYEQITVDWNLPFDEMITVIEGVMHIHSDGTSDRLGPGDVPWFPAHTPLTYEVPDRVIVSYAIHPLPPVQP